MLIVHCPVCGIEGDETDFHCGGQAHIARPATSDPDNIADGEQRDYLFMRFNRSRNTSQFLFICTRMMKCFWEIIIKKHV